jgi:putative glutamine amidotransferase
MSEGPRIGIVGAPVPDLELHDRIVSRSGGSLVALDGEATVHLDAIGGLIVASDQPGALISAAVDRGLPVLGTGAGMLALNVAFGGAGPMEVEAHGIELEDGEPKPAYHRIYIAPGSKLAAIVGSGGFVRVNSRHDVGLREAQKSPRLLASAYGLEDGVIEALESPEHDWVIAVQFNPERRMELPPHFDRLFQGLVERAAR